MINNKKILILGATGALGHKLLETAIKSGYAARGTIREANPALEKIGISEDRLFCGLDIEEEKGIKQLNDILKSEKFDAVINCIGIIPQKPKDRAKTIYCNSLFPHIAAGICAKNKSKLVHISTDCVFSGKKGMYEDRDEPDALDLYGKSKELGEVVYGNHLTIRTSFIGREISGKKAGLLEWFLSQSGQVNGFSKAIWSGFTTASLSGIICSLAGKDFQSLAGLVHVSNQPIDKYSLLVLCKKYFGKEITINKDTDFKCDKSLKMSELLKDIVRIRPYEEIIEELAREKYPA